ncbi:glycine cleavage system aminomethyltransferase GcvT [soil metagenome]
MVGKKTPLNDWHAANGARFVEAHGWVIPDAYGKVEQEYAALRNGAGFVDFSHEARFRVEGGGAVPFLNELFTLDISKIPVNSSAFGYTCNNRGGIIDAFTIYRDDAYYMLLGSGGPRAETLEWMEAAARKTTGPAVYITDITQTHGQLSLRGPGAMAMLERVAFGQKFNMEPGAAAFATIDTAKALVIRRTSGGTDSYDVIVGSVFLQPIWDKFVEASRATGARAVGQAAREIVRIESGVPTHGAEINAETTPIDINEQAAIDFTKKSFNGRRALMHSASSEFSRSLVSLKLDPTAVIEVGSEILFESLPIGIITSTVLSPATRSRIAMGFINTMKSAPGTAVKVKGKNGLVAAEVVKAR